MSIGSLIIFAPVDRSWVATPKFIRGVASMFGVDTCEYFSIYREVAVPPGVELSWDEQEEKLLWLDNVPLEKALTLQRIDPDCSTSFHFGNSDLLNAIGEDVIATLPKSLSEGYAPLEVTLCNGRWIHYEYSGDGHTEGACCLKFSNDLGYPIDKDDYLKAFLTVPAVVQFQQRLEKLSSQPWSGVLIDLT